MLLLDLRGLFKLASLRGCAVTACFCPAQCPGLGTKTPANRRALLAFDWSDTVKDGVEKMYRRHGFFPKVGGEDILARVAWAAGAAAAQLRLTETSTLPSRPVLIAY